VVSIRTITGREARDDGSECNLPLPGGDLRDFNFEVKDSRDQIRLVEPPSRRNHYRAMVRIRDTSGGEGRYHFRLTWALSGTMGYPPPRGPAGFAWNNVTHYSGRGRGVSQASGYGSQRLLDASVDVDRGGRVIVSFRTDGGRPLMFSGMIIGRDGEVLKADVATDDQVLRGPMYLSVNGRGNVYRVTLNAGNGQASLELTWEGR
jgi:hypothetical protein